MNVVGRRALRWLGRLGACDAAAELRQFANDDGGCDDMYSAEIVPLAPPLALALAFALAPPTAPPCAVPGGPRNGLWKGIGARSGALKETLAAPCTGYARRPPCCPCPCWWYCCW